MTDIDTTARDAAWEEHLEAQRARQEELARADFNAGYAAGLAAAGPAAEPVDFGSLVGWIRAFLRENEDVRNDPAYRLVQEFQQYFIVHPNPDWDYDAHYLPHYHREQRDGPSW